MRRTWGALVVSVCLALVGCASGPTTGATGPTPNIPTAPTATATVDALKTPLPSQGWVTVPALNIAKNMAFSASDPLTGYACGNLILYLNQGVSNTLELSVTHDGGRTWSPAAMTTIHGAGCDLSINPANPNDLILRAWACYTGCQFVVTPYRSHDGGKTWTALTFEPAQWPANPAHLWEVSKPAWIGDTAYFAVVFPGGVGPMPRPAHAFVSNTSGSALSTPNDAIYSSVTDPNALPTAIWSHGSTLVEVLNDEINSQGNPAYAVESTDTGATWQVFTAAGLSALRNLSSQDGAVGIDFNPYADVTVAVQSSDGGLTWNHLPTLPQRGPNDNPTEFSIVRSADGTVALIGPQQSVWLLAPGASVWKNVATLVSGNEPYAAQVLTLSTDMTAHPLLIWALVTYANGVPLPGVAYRALA